MELALDEQTVAKAIAMPANQATRTYLSEKRIWQDYQLLVSSERDADSDSEQFENDRWGMARLVRPLIKQSLATFRSQLANRAAECVGDLFDVNHICLKVEQDSIRLAWRIIQRTCLLELKVARLSGMLRGNTSQARFRSFLKLLESPSFAGRLFLEYPVLLKVVASKLEFHIQNALDLITRLINDRENIESQLFDGIALGSLEDWKTGQGDSHCRGASVATLKFSDGRRLVYKPRSLRVDIGFSEIVQWCNDELPGLPLRTARTLDCETHGWSEHIEHRELESKEDIHAFFYRQGKFIALFHVLHASDLHYENMIACGATPIYIDLETLFHAAPWLNLEVNTSPESGIPGLAVNHTLILPPGRKISNENPTMDVSIFGAATGQEFPDAVFELANIGTDEMHLRKRSAFLETSSHLPMYLGETVPWSDHVAAVIEGFQDLYKCFERKASSLSELISAAFSTASFRLVVRHTALYSSMIQNSLHPDYLRDELERYALFERLFSTSSDDAWANRLLAAEMRDMTGLDVPYFSRNFDDDRLFDSTGEPIVGVCLPSPKTIATRQLSRLGEDDMRTQIRLIEISLSTDGNEDRHAELAEQISPVRHEATTFVAKYLEESVGIANILTRQLSKSGGNHFWMCQTLEKETLAIMSPSILNLYEGQLGIIQYFGALAAVTSHSEYENTALRGLETVRRWTQSGRKGFQSHGVYTGSMGYAYVFTCLGLMLNKDYLLDEALGWIDAFDPERDNDGLDVIDGAAGCALFLTQLLEVPRASQKSGDAVIRLIDFFAKRIAREAKKEAVGVSWRIPRHPGNAQIGFAHGNAGFAAALFSCAQALDQETYRELGHAALRYENSRDAVDHFSLIAPQNSDDKRAANNTKCAWCHGPSGMALGRLIALEATLHDAVSRDLLIADLKRDLRATADFSDAGNASLCHGTLGNNEIFAMGSHFLSNHGLDTFVQQLSTRREDVTERRCGDPKRNTVDSRHAPPGLMTGLAGIGYGLLRSAAPERVPSVIRLAVKGMA